MPHKCVRCDKVYESDSLAVRTGCECGAKVFIYYSEKKNAPKESEKQWVEKELAGIASKSDSPVSLDIENVRVLDKGVFEVNVGSLIQNPLIIKGDDGVYYVKLPGMKKEKKQ